MRNGLRPSIFAEVNMNKNFLHTFYVVNTVFNYNCHLPPMRIRTVRNDFFMKLYHAIITIRLALKVK